MLDRNTRLCLCLASIIGLSGCASQTVGEMDLLRGDYAAAQAKIQERLASHPDDLSSRRRLGMAYYKDGKYAQAAEQFAYVLQRTDNMPDLQIYHGLALIGAGKPLEGQEALARFSYPRHYRIEQEVRAEAGRLETTEDLGKLHRQLQDAWDRGQLFEEQEMRPERRS